MVVSAPITTDMAVPPNDLLKEATNAEPEENVDGSTSTSSSSPGESIAAAHSPHVGNDLLLLFCSFCAAMQRPTKRNSCWIFSLKRI